VAIAPEQLHAGKGVFQRREHALGSFLIRMMGFQHFDRQQVALRIKEATSQSDKRDLGYENKPNLSNRSD
jgi:hypothetical protein